MIFPARELVAHGFELLATSGTAEVLKRNGINATVVRKQSEGDGPERREDHRPAHPRRRRSTSSSTPPTAPAAGSTATRSVPPPSPAPCPCLTTVQALAAAVQGIDALNRGDVGVRSLQEHAEHLTAARD